MTDIMKIGVGVGVLIIRNLILSKPVVNCRVKAHGQCLEARLTQVSD